MIDTHSHIYLEQFDEDLEEVLNRAAEAGVTDIFMPAIDFSSIKLMDDISHPEIKFYKMAGLHPADIKELEDGFEKKLYELCLKDDIYGVGETGLDYYWSTDHVTEQKLSLHAHCRVAKKTGKPVILHNRESTSDMLHIIEQEQDGSLSGIWHCFNGTVEEGRKAIDLGLYLGIGGVITFKNGGVDETVAQLPLNKMVLETDAPYLSPTPMRGKRNEPSYMRYTAARVSEIFDIPLADVIEETSRNARTLFDI